MISRETLIELVKDAPVPITAGLTLFGVSINGIILTLTVLWALFRAVSAGIDLYQKVKELRNGKSK